MSSNDVHKLRHDLEMVASGDRAALRAVYDRTNAKLFGICLRILGDREEAEDALQDVYVSVWKGAASFDPERASPISWLASFARNRAIDRLRSSRRSRLTDPLDQAADVPDGSADAFVMAASEQDRQRLADCLGALDDRQQGAIRSAFFEGLTYAQVAERSGDPLGTVKSWVRRGLSQLKMCLER